MDVKKIEFRDSTPKSCKPQMPLFKYYANIQYVKDLITNRRIHLEEPSAYNDIYDSSFCIVENDLYKVFWGRYLDNPLIKRYLDMLSWSDVETIKKFDISIGDKIDFIIERIGTRYRRELVEISLQIIRGGDEIIIPSGNKISCFSENNNSLLMWAYYANSYKGVCAEFDTTKNDIIGKNCRQIRYSRTYVKDNTFNHYFTKSKEWKHEHEWRIVAYTDEEYLDIESLKAIYFGRRIEREEKDELIKLCKTYTIDAYDMRLSMTKYELMFEKIL